MKKILRLFYQELKIYSQRNWWVFVVLLFSLLAIVLTNRGCAVEVGLIFIFHFMADILFMMMAYEYSLQNYKPGTFYQIIGTSIFFCIKIYVGIKMNTWHYLAADLIYILAAIKNYWKDVKTVHIYWIDYRIMFLLSTAILFIIYVPHHLIHTPSQWVQTCGIFLFAIALCITHSERTRYFASLSGLLAMISGSFWEVLRTFLEGQTSGLALSYFLLPLTVFIVYAKLFKRYIKLR